MVPEEKEVEAEEMEVVPEVKEVVPAAVKKSLEVPSEVWSMLAYSDQARMATVAKTYATRMEVVFKDLGFSQNNFHWTFKEKNKMKTQVTSTCTAIAFLGAVEFYTNPDLMLAEWANDELWRGLDKRGAKLHKPLMEKFWMSETVLRAALGTDVWFLRPDEIVARLDALALSDQAFAPLRAFHAKRSMYALTSK